MFIKNKAFKSRFLLGLSLSLFCITTITIDLCLMHFVQKSYYPQIINAKNNNFENMLLKIIDKKYQINDINNTSEMTCILQKDLTQTILSFLNDTNDVDVIFNEDATYSQTNNWCIDLNSVYLNYQNNIYQLFNDQTLVFNFQPTKDLNYWFLMLIFADVFIFIGIVYFLVNSYIRRNWINEDDSI